MENNICYGNKGVIDALNYKAAYLGRELIYKDDIPMILEYTTTSASEEITLPIGTMLSSVTPTIDVKVNWGDGSAIQTIKTSAPKHKYSRAGKYNVQISGKCNLFNGNSSKNTTKVISWGSSKMGIIEMESMFNQCSELTEVAPDTYGAFKNVTNCNNMFFGARKLLNVNKDLFKYGNKITTMQNIFCSMDTVNITEGLFDNLTSLKDISGGFSYNLKLPSIPNNLFDNCKQINNFEFTFIYCMALNSRPPFTIIDGKEIELWERAGLPGFPSTISGVACFSDCYRIPNRERIPTNWR